MRQMTPLHAGHRPPGPANGSRPDPRERRDAALADLRSSLKDLLRSLLRATTGIVLDGVENLAETFERTAATGGLAVGGLLGGVRAGLAGRNPLWGALKGAVGSLGPGMRIALIVALLLAIVLLPITVVLLLVALIVVVIVAAAKAGS